MAFCPADGCGKWTDSVYCVAHNHLAPAPPPKVFTGGRERNPWDAWYSGALWKKIRLHFQATQPGKATTCQHIENGRMCGLPAEVIDHVIPHKGNWKLFCGGVNYENLQGLCKHHHDQKTRGGK